MDYYIEIKKELINNAIIKKTKELSKNKSELIAYYNVGKLLFEAGKNYGNGIIEKYSIKLTEELGKGYGASNLKRMRQFYQLIEKGVAMPHFLSWSHILTLLPIENINKVNYYISISEKMNLTYSELRTRIKKRTYRTNTCIYELCR